MKWIVLALASLLGGVALQARSGVVRVVVAQDGSGDFTTIQRAVDHVLDKTATAEYERAIIEIRPGIYRERVIVAQDKPRFTLRGAGADSTTITASMSAKTTGGTFFSAIVDVNGTGFEAEGLTIENSYGVGSQAVAISVHSDRAVFRRCRFLGRQDTLYAASGRQYYADCFIEGDVDFVFGNAAAVFERCEVHSRAPGYVAAVSRTLADGATGFVFDTLPPDRRGRRRQRLPRAALARLCARDLSRLLDGSAHRGGRLGQLERISTNEKTAWFAESGSTGPGASIEGRASSGTTVGRRRGAAISRSDIPARRRWMESRRVQDSGPLNNRCHADDARAGRPRPRTLSDLRGWDDRNRGEVDPVRTRSVR